MPETGGARFRRCAHSSRTGAICSRSTLGQPIHRGVERRAQLISPDTFNRSRGPERAGLHGTAFRGDYREANFSRSRSAAELAANNKRRAPDVRRAVPADAAEGVPGLDYHHAFLRARFAAIVPDGVSACPPEAWKSAPGGTGLSITSRRIRAAYCGFALVRLPARPPGHSGKTLTSSLLTGKRRESRRPTVCVG